MLACVFVHTLVPVWVTAVVCVLIVVATQGSGCLLPAGAATMAVLSLTIFQGPLYVVGLMFVTGLLLFGSLWLQRARPPHARWAGPMLLVCWTLPLTLLALWALGVPPAVVESCTACKSHLKNYSTAVEMYWSDHNKTYPGTLDELVPKYLNRPMLCPGGLEDNPRARVFYRKLGIELADGYGYRRQGDTYYIWCRTRGIAMHSGHNQPWLSGVSGLQTDAWFPENLPGTDRRSELSKGPAGEPKT